MFWTIWFWLGLLAGWVVTVGHCMNTWVSGFLFTIIVYFFSSNIPNRNFFILAHALRCRNFYCSHSISISYLSIDISFLLDSFFYGIFWKNARRNKSGFLPS